MIFERGKAMLTKNQIESILESKLHYYNSLTNGNEQDTQIYSSDHVLGEIWLLQEILGMSDNELEKMALTCKN